MIIGRAVTPPVLSSISIGKVVEKERQTSGLVYEGNGETYRRRTQQGVEQHSPCLLPDLELLFIHAFE